MNLNHRKENVEYQLNFTILKLTRSSGKELSPNFLSLQAEYLIWHGGQVRQYNNKKPKFKESEFPTNLNSLEWQGCRQSLVRGNGVYPGKVRMAAG
jgi:hypothetical protein